MMEFEEPTDSAYTTNAIVKKERNLDLRRRKKYKNEK